MPLAHQRYLTYNTDDFTRWATTVGPMTEKTVQYFLTSGKAPEQGYKACSSLRKWKNVTESTRSRKRLWTYFFATQGHSVRRSVNGDPKNDQINLLKTLRRKSQPQQTATEITRGTSYFNVRIEVAMTMNRKP